MYVLRVEVKTSGKATETASMSTSKMKSFHEAYTDIFGHFNETSFFLQGRDVTVSDVHDRLAGPSAQM